MTQARERLLAAGLAALLGAGVWLVGTPAVRAATGGYPFANIACEWAPYATTGPAGTQWCRDFDWGTTPSTVINGVEAIDETTTTSSRGFGYRNCTDFVAFKLGINSSTVHGNAVSWRDELDPAYVTHSAAVGAVAWWGTETGAGFGHVAVVISLKSGSAVVAEYNARLDGMYDTRTIAAHGPGSADAFLHIKDEAIAGGVRFVPPAPPGPSPASPPAGSPPPAHSPAPAAAPSPAASPRPSASSPPSPSPSASPPPTPAPPPPVSPPVAGTLQAARLKATLETGLLTGLARTRVTFAPPGMLRPGESRLVEASIDHPGQLSAALRQQLAPGATGTVTSGTAGDPVEASLSGSGLQIVATTPAQQPMVGTDRAVWQWRITPTAAGPASVTLCLAVDVAAPGGTASGMPSCLPARVIAVTTFPAFLAGRSNRSLIRLGLVAALALGIAAGVLGRQRRARGGTIP